MKGVWNHITTSHDTTSRSGKSHHVCWMDSGLTLCNSKVFNRYCFVSRRPSKGDSMLSDELDSKPEVRWFIIRLTHKTERTLVLAVSVQHVTLFSSCWLSSCRTPPFHLARVWRSRTPVQRTPVCLFSRCQRITPYAAICSWQVAGSSPTAYPLSHKWHSFHLLVF